MLDFFRKLLIYVLPVATPVLVLTALLIHIGESMPLYQVMQLQASDDPVLFRVAYGNRDQRYKLMNVDYRQPDVLMIGSSRVLQFRGAFLNRNPDAFYNAAAPAWQIEEINRLLFAMDHRPDVLLLGIDYPWFNDNYAGDPIVEPPTALWDRLWIVNRTFMQQLLDGETFLMGPLLAREEPGGSGGLAIGIRAIRDGHGFRNDGSEQYGDFLVAQHLWQPNMRGHHVGLFERGEEMYVEGAVVSADAMGQLDALLAFAAAENIEVIGFLPPYMPSLWQQMATSPRHSYIPQVQSQLNDLFGAYGFMLYDFSNGADVGATDEDFFDGWHHSEKIAAQMYITMARQNPTLQAFSDLDRLQATINAAPDTFRAFPFVTP